jgi:hypothetical protein
MCSLPNLLGESYDLTNNSKLCTDFLLLFITSGIIDLLPICLGGPRTDLEWNESAVVLSNHFGNAPPAVKEIEYYEHIKGSAVAAEK